MPNKDYQSYSSDNKTDLLNCPFCGSDQVFVWKRPEAIPRYFVICPGCERDINGESTHQQAIAAWNRRASPSWSTEPPTEEGYYWYRVSCNDKYYLGPFICRIEGHDAGAIQYEASGKLIKKLVKHWLEGWTDKCIVYWQKINDPTEPEESEVPHD